MSKNNNFVIVATTGEVQNSETKMKKVKLNEEIEICVSYVKGKFYAIGDKCTHRYCPLSAGVLMEYEVQCMCHFAKFDVRDGSVTAPPAVDPVPAYELKIENDNILIKIPKQIPDNSPP